MKFRIPIYPEIHAENAAIFWKHYHGHPAESIWWSIGLGAVITRVAVIPPWPSWVMFLVIFFALAFIARSIAGIIRAQRLRKDFIFAASIFYLSKDEMIVECTEDHFSYFDTRQQRDIPWKNFSSCFVKKDVLFLVINTEETFMISKRVMYPADFNDLTQYVLRRTKGEPSEINKLLSGEKGWY